MSFVPDKIKSYEWYYNKLPLYLKNSYGFSEHFKIWYELLISGDKNGIVNVGDTLLYLFNIFDFTCFKEWNCVPTILFD